MRDFEAQMRFAFEQHLPVPLESATLGQVFKALLEFYRDQKYDWVVSDDLLLTIDVEFADSERMGGVLGWFGLSKPGDPINIVVTLERALDSIAETDEDDETETDPDDDRYESLLLELEYEIQAITDFKSFEGLYEDSTDYETLEEFVKSILENPAFQQLALLKPKLVSYIEDTDDAALN